MPAITQDELIGRIKTKLGSRPHGSTWHHYKAVPEATEPAAYVLILGAGFSYGVMPLVHELMHQTIGDYYVPDMDQSGERPADALRKHSAYFWAEFNEAVVKGNLPIVELNHEGLPANPSAAYQSLFTFEGANILFEKSEEKTQARKRMSWIGRLEERREKIRAGKKPAQEKSTLGAGFVRGFLRYVLDPGCESGYGSTGRSSLNEASIYLAALLEAQQLGDRWKTCAFCRTLITTNFDTLLQNALQMVNLLYRLTDRPEHGLERPDFDTEEGAIHLVYAHGSILRHNPASTIEEVGGLATKNIEVLRDYLECRDVIAIGYSGWNDGLMAALRRCDSNRHKIYWCGVDSQPASHIAEFLRERAGSAAYVDLGKTGADGLMRALYFALVPAEAQRDPRQRYRDWRALGLNRNAPDNVPQPTGATEVDSH